MGEEVGPHLWVANVPDASINKVVVDIDEAHKHEEVILEAAIRIVNHLIYSHKNEEAGGGESSAVLQEVLKLG